MLKLMTRTESLCQFDRLPQHFLCWVAGSLHQDLSRRGRRTVNCQPPVGKEISKAGAQRFLQRGLGTVEGGFSSVSSVCVRANELCR